MNNSSILCCIPINDTPYSMIEYNSPNNFRSNLFINSLSKINIKLCDDKGNLIDLNGQYFNMVIQLYVVQFMTEKRQEAFDKMRGKLKEKKENKLLSKKKEASKLLLLETEHQGKTT
jgi:hypothetical protein